MAPFTSKNLTPGQIEMKRIEEIGELTHCKKCKKPIWKYWHKPLKGDPLLKPPEMDKCFYCFFRK